MGLQGMMHAENYGINDRAHAVWGPPLALQPSQDTNFCKTRDEQDLKRILMTYIKYYIMLVI